MTREQIVPAIFGEYLTKDLFAKALGFEEAGLYSAG